MTRWAISTSISITTLTSIPITTINITMNTIGPMGTTTITIIIMKTGTPRDRIITATGTSIKATNTVKVKQQLESTFD